jgi:hypothetical protein
MTQLVDEHHHAENEYESSPMLEPDQPFGR